MIYEGEHYYIEKAPYGLRELSEPERKTDGHLSPSIYKGKLKSLMADCPAVDEDIATARLDYPSLVGLARKYHNNDCNNDNCIIYQRPPSPASLKFGIIAGYTVNKYKLGKEFISNYGMGFQFGAGMKIQNAVFSNDKFSIITNTFI